jgi:anti-sigma factor RsiW
MKCSHVRNLFGAYWDDDTTQAEREWVDAHLANCVGCRREYEELAKVLEWTTSLPRTEVAPDLVERTLARARRAATASDRVPTVAVPWVPVTAAAVVLLVAGTLISPWTPMGSRTRVAQREPSVAVQQPVLVQPAPGAADQPALAPGAEAVATVPDSLFDHSEDVEFILDPVTLRRDRATVTRSPGGLKAEQAVISF